MRIAICDVGLGNLRSVERALTRAAATYGRVVEVEVTRDADRVRHADKVVVPGQAAFGDCAGVLGLTERTNESGLAPGTKRTGGAAGLGAAVREQIARGAPYLGICLGLQMLFGTSDEAPGAAGLGALPGRVVKLPGGVDPATGLALKIPHAGWNTVEPESHRGLLPAEPTHFYFAHSFAGQPDDATLVAGTTEYGSRFVSAVAKDNVFACQFHPEKSQRAGLALLVRFVAL